MHRKLPRYIALTAASFKHLADFGYRVRTVLGEVVSLAAVRPSVPAFRGAVTSVVRCCASKQVCRSYARRIIAFVQNPKSCRDWAARHDPRSAMRWDHLAHHLAGAVPGAVFAGGPDPAPSELGAMRRYWTILVDLQPKSGREGWWERLPVRAFFASVGLHSISPFDCVSRSRLLPTARGHLFLCAN